MQKLLDQFILLEKKCIELLDFNKALRSELNKTKEANKLQEDNYSVEEEGEIHKSMTTNHGQVNKRQELTSTDIACYIKEIDDCLEILKTIEG